MSGKFYEDEADFIKYRTIMPVFQENSYPKKETKYQGCSNLESVDEDLQKKGEKYSVSEISIVKISSNLNVLFFILCIMIISQIRLLVSLEQYLYLQQLVKLKGSVINAIALMVLVLAVIKILKDKIRNAKEIKRVGRIFQGMVFILIINLLLECIFYNNSIEYMYNTIFSIDLFLVLIPFLLYIEIMIQREVFKKSKSS